jgi:hypothetical protein
MQFSLRTGFLLVTLLCVGLSMWCIPAERQRRAVAAIKKLGGNVGYVEPAASKALPRTLRRWLPPEYFDGIESVFLDEKNVMDAGLAHLRGLTGLQQLHLSRSQVTDAGLAHLHALADLQTLSLDGTQVTDAGLAHLQGLTGLQVLYLDYTQVTDAGLAHLQGLTALHRLGLSATQVTDAGMVHLQRMTGLRWLSLDSTQVTDAGLAHLQGLMGLQQLNLNDTQVRDAGLALAPQHSGHGCRHSKTPSGIAKVRDLWTVTDSRTPVAYCLMSNHWHLVLWPERDGDLGAFSRRTKRSWRPSG